VASAAWPIAPGASDKKGHRLRRGLLDKTNTAGGVWADTACRSAVNETLLAKNEFVSHVHRKKPKGRAMPEVVRRANNAKSEIRLRDALQKCRRPKKSGH